MTYDPAKVKYEDLLEDVWGKGPESDGPSGKAKRPTREELKRILSPLQYKVTQEDGTEPPFKNEYRDLEKEGYGMYKHLFER